MTSDPPATDLLARQRVHYAKYASSIDSEGNSPKCLIKFSWVTARSHEKSSALVAAGPPARPRSRGGSGDGGAVSGAPPALSCPTARPPCAPGSPGTDSPPGWAGLDRGAAGRARGSPGAAPEVRTGSGRADTPSPPPPRAGTAPPAPFPRPSPSPCPAAQTPQPWERRRRREEEEEEETDPSSAAFLHRTPPFSPPSGLSAALAGPERAGGAGRRLAQHGRAMCILRNNSSCCAHDGEQRNARRRGLAGAGERAGPAPLRGRS